MLLGNKNPFAIELNLVPSVPLFGGIRFWFCDDWLGELKVPILLGHIAEGLNAVRGSRRYRCRLAFLHDEEVPSFEALHRQSHWSFGESFDDFAFVYFAVHETRTVHWVWEARAPILQKNPNYPARILRASIPYDSYDAVVGEFLKTLSVPDDVEAGVTWSFDPRKSQP